MSAERSRISVEPIFATPFVSVNTGAGGELNERLAKHCVSLQDQPGQRTFFDSDADPVRALRDVMLGHAARAIESVNAFTPDQKADLRVEARAWCTVVQPSGHIAARHYPGASWLAVYCVQSGEADEGYRNAGVLRIHETRLESVYRDASSWAQSTPYRFGHYTWAPKPGGMVLFPAHVRHEISVVRSSTPLILVFALIRFTDAGAPDIRLG